MLRLFFILAVTVGGLRAAEPPEYSEAVRLVEKQQWREALALIEHLKKEYPSNSRVLNLEGLAYLAGKDTANASECFESALQASPGFFPALKNLAILEWQKNPEGNATAVSRTEQALESNGSDPVLNAYGILSSLQKKDAALAEKRMTAAGNAIAALPLFLEAHAALAFAGMHSYPQAETLFQNLLERGVNTPVLRYNFALAQLLSGDAKRATNTLEALHPRSSDASNLLAQAYWKDKQSQKAVDTLRKAIAADPGYEDNYLDLSSLCVDLNLQQEGREVIGAGLDRLPKSARLNFQAGLMLALAGEFSQAGGYFEKAAKLEPHADLPGAAVELAEIQESRLPEAIAGLREKLRENPHSALLSYLLGAALVRSSESSAASAEVKAAFEKANELDPRLPFPYLELGKIYARENRDPEAIRMLEKAASYPSIARSAYYQLAIIYRRHEQMDRAREMLAKVQDLNRRDRTPIAFGSSSEEKN